MAIGSINIAMGASSIGAYTQKLTNQTKQKLEELGIPFDNNTTESQGKKLLQAYEASKSNNNGNSFNQNQSSSDLYKRAEKLAKQLGINIEQGEEFKSILSKIETVLEQKIEMHKNNPIMLEKLNNLSHELANIQAQSNGSSGYDNTNQALMMSLEMLSEYNKNFLNK